MNISVANIHPMPHLTRDILCSTRPVHPDDRKPLWEERKRQARIDELVDRVFPQRHPERVPLSVPARVRAFFRHLTTIRGRK
jgi:hypothetical protein